MVYQGETFYWKLFREIINFDARDFYKRDNPSAMIIYKSPIAIDSSGNTVTVDIVGAAPYGMTFDIYGTGNQFQLVFTAQSLLNGGERTFTVPVELTETSGDGSQRTTVVEVPIWVAIPELSIKLYAGMAALMALMLSI